MNKTYRLIWSDAKQTWVVTHERAKTRGKPSSRSKPLAAALTSALLLHSPYLRATDPNALPTGGQVVAGQANISQSGTAMTIQQSTDKAILNWNSFSVGSNASVAFLQPSSSSITLNRVIGSDPSAIYGSLTANGQVFLINPNGVLFGQGARIDVAGLVASTLNLRNDDFLAGNLRFTRDGATGSVVNEGDIYGHYVALLAPEVRNQGLIAARQGTVALAAGDAVTLNITGNTLVDVQVDPASINTLVENRHLIQAQEGLVILTAKSVHNLLGKVINSGEIDATGISSDGGTVRLLASSEIEHSGTIDVSAGQTGTGGTATLIADLDNPNSKTTISGKIFSRGGSTSGDGGFVETSASRLRITDDARVNTSALNGKRGLWLLDPTDFVVDDAGTGDMLATTLSTNLDDGMGGGTNVTIQSINGGGGTNGDVIINSAVTWANTSILTLEADRDIRINAAIDISFMGALHLDYGRAVAGTGKATIASGVAWSPFGGTIIDVTNGMAATAAANVNTTTYDYLIGTKGLNTYVRAIAGHTNYGDPINYGFFDAAAAGTRYNVLTLGGTPLWSTNAGATTFSTFNAATYNTLTYQSGFTVPDSRYTLATGNSVNGVIVDPRAITLTANNQTKAQGTAITLGAGSTAFSRTSGSMAYAEQIDSVTLGEATGKASSLAAIAGAYVGEMTIGTAVGSVGFNASNYAITYQTGNLTITASAPPPTPTTTTTSCNAPNSWINGVCTTLPTSVPTSCLPGQEVGINGQCVTVKKNDAEPALCQEDEYSPFPGMCAPRTKECADGLELTKGDATHNDTCAPPPPPINCGNNEIRPYGYQGCTPCADGTVPDKAGTACVSKWNDANKKEWQKSLDDVKLPNITAEPTPMPDATMAKMTKSSYAQHLVNNGLSEFAKACDEQLKKGVPQEQIDAYKKERLQSYIADPDGLCRTQDKPGCPNQELVTALYNSAGLKPSESDLASYPKANYNPAKRYSCDVGFVADNQACLADARKLPEPTKGYEAPGIARAIKNAENKSAFVANWQRDVITPQLKATQDSSGKGPKPWLSLDDFVKEMQAKLDDGSASAKDVQAFKESKLAEFLATASRGGCSSDPRTINCSRELIVAARDKLGLPALDKDALEKYPSLGDYYDAAHADDWKKTLDSNTFPGGTPAPTNGPNPALASMTNAQYVQYSLGAATNQLKAFADACNQQVLQGVPKEKIDAYKEERLAAYLKTTGNNGPCPDGNIGCPNKEVVRELRNQMGLLVNDEELAKYPVADYQLAKRYGAAPDAANLQIQSMLRDANIENLTPKQRTKLIEEIAKSLGIDPSRIQVQSVTSN